MSRLKRNHFHGGIVLEACFPPALSLSLSPCHASAMREMGELGSSSSPSPSSSIAHSSVFHSYPLISAVLAFAIAQSIKFFTTWYKERHWDAKQLIRSGGMPSSHSATVTALALAIGIQDGLDSSAFATAVILAFVVLCDAFGVRLHAGKQAEVLNQIMYELPEEHPLSDTRPLHELLGHTPIQVIAGAALGSVVAIAAQLINRFAGGAWQSEIINKLIDDN